MNIKPVDARQSWDTTPLSNSTSGATDDFWRHGDQHNDDPSHAVSTHAVRLRSDDVDMWALRCTVRGVGHNTPRSGSSLACLLDDPHDGHWLPRGGPRMVGSSMELEKPISAHPFPHANHDHYHQPIVYECCQLYYSRENHRPSWLSV